MAICPGFLQKTKDSNFIIPELGEGHFVDKLRAGVTSSAPFVSPSGQSS